MSTARVLVAVAFVLVCAPVAAGASEHVVLRTSFSPERLGASTTIVYGFQITASNGQVPSPLTGIDLHLPAGMGLASSSLGLATCDPTVLQEQGAEGCPAEARLGYGHALVKVPSPDGVIEEAGTVEAVLGPPQGEHLVVLFYVEGNEPVQAQLVFPGEVLSDLRPFGTHVDTSIPLIPAWSEGPDVVVSSFSSTIGPLHLTYYRKVRGKLVPFHPRGIAVPASCPHGGFPFAADFDFADGTHVLAKSFVPCPAARAGNAAGRPRPRARGRARASRAEL